MNYQNQKLRQMLAAEYVAGTLVGSARKRFRRLLKTDADLQREVRNWEARLGSLDTIEPVAPRDLVWTGIEQRIAQERSKVVPIKVERPTVRINVLRLWGATATAAAIVMAVLLFRQSSVVAPQQGQPQIVSVPAQAFVAAIKLPEEEGQWTVSLVPDSRSLRIHASQPAKLAADRDYQLWWIDDSGGTTSLGLLPRSGAFQFALPAKLTIAGPGTVAVSLEPAGGSPVESSPSGPVLTAAPLLSMI